MAKPALTALDTTSIPLDRLSARSNRIYRYNHAVTDYFLHDTVSPRPICQRSIREPTESLWGSPNTLWLRILGQENVQIRAIAELARLPVEHPYRQNALELFSNLKIVLESKQNKNSDETELMMNLSPLYLEQIDLATQKGRVAGEATGLERGRVAEGRSLIIRQLTRKLGQLNPETIAQIDCLGLDAIESLGDALLDFSSMEDLRLWLNDNRSPNGAPDAPEIC
jgi:Domain of unknown function (DUF4351)